ncbi:hypothetical protein OAX78_04190 [Planctomycetota bacterium]|nr:hypothetical protein [Planctomycetota bacterium]
MSDERLRELERRWKETQAVEDEAAYLLERVRVGDLEQEKLELAAYCGDGAAKAALGGSGPIPTLDEWIQGVFAKCSDEGERNAVDRRVGATLARLACSLPRHDLVGEHVANFCIAMERWVAFGEAGNADRANQARLRAAKLAADVSDLTYIENLEGRGLIETAELVQIGTIVFYAAVGTRRDSPTPRALYGVSAESLEEPLGEGRVQAALGVDISSWALGRGNAGSRYSRDISQQGASQTRASS